MAGYFRMEVKVVSRKNRHKNGSVTKNSAISAAAYISAERMRELHAIEAASYISGTAMVEEAGNTVVDYTNKKGVIESWMVLPQYAPEKYRNPEILWNDVERLEKSIDADLYREWIGCFDKHLTAEQKKLVAEEFAQSLASEGMIVFIAMHSGKEGNDNDHFHALAPTRGFNIDGTWQDRKVKPRGYQYDENGNKIPVIDKKTGNPKIGESGRAVWKRVPREYVNEWNDPKKGNVERWRQTFADIENQYLAPQFQVSPDSYIKQGIDKLPQKHLGKSGIATQRALSEQVRTLDVSTRKDMLEKILQQIQKDYRRLYYENSRELNKNRRVETSDHYQLRKSVYSELQRAKKHYPRKKGISFLDGRSQLSIEKSLADIADYYRRLSQNTDSNQEDDMIMIIDFVEKAIQAEEYLISTFAYAGTTRACENFIVLNEYEIKRDLLKKIGNDIRETEIAIKNIKLEDGENIGEYERKLGEYRKQLESLERSAGTFGTAGKADSKIVESAISVSAAISEFRESEKRLGDMRSRIADSTRKILEYSRGNVAKSTNKFLSKS